jgi:hypothetical protein
VQQQVETSEPESDFYDENVYLSRYPDIAAAVAAGKWPNGYAHYKAHGKAEGRKAGNFDTAFYLASYPLAAAEIAEGRYQDAMDHYRRIGFARGYIPTPVAERPAHASRLPQFGGFWADRPDALDVVDGKLEVGQIDEKQAEQLRFWIKNGYVILPGALPPRLATRALKEVDRAYAGGFNDLLFECAAMGAGHRYWSPELAHHAAKALDLHYFSPVIREVMFAPAIVNFLALIFESKAFASQSLTFYRGSAQDPHQDSAYVAYSVPRQFAASWVAVEDVTIGAGELFYYDGSHRFPDFLYGGKHKSVSEANRVGPKDKLPTEIPAHVKNLIRLAQVEGLEKSVFAAKKGDALIWHADLVHGGNPISHDVTCKSVVTHYCPKRRAPLFAERMQLKLEEHQGHFYTTGMQKYLDL